MQTLTRFAAALLALALGATPLLSPAGEETGLTLSAGLDYSTGEYGLAAETDLVYLPVSLKYSDSPWTFKLTAAYLHLTGPGSIAADGPGASLVGASTRRATESGLGDVLASITYATEAPAFGDNYLDLTLKVKLPLADADRGLGTGEVDYTVQLDILRSEGPWTPFATVGYRFIGESRRFDLNDAWLASLGLDRRFNAAISAGLVLDFREAIAAGADNGLELIPYLAWSLGGGYSLSAYGIAGLSDGSPDLGVGTQLSYRFRGAR